MTHGTWITSIFLIFSSLACSVWSADLSVTVENVPVNRGTLLIGIYDSADTFRVNQLSQSIKVPVKQKGSISAVIPNLKPGKYAIAVVHDLNGNDKLDRGGFKIPIEPFGFTNNPKIMFGPPKFDQCVINVEEKQNKVRVVLKTK